MHIPEFLLPSLGDISIQDLRTWLTGGCVVRKNFRGPGARAVSLIAAVHDAEAVDPVVVETSLVAPRSGKHFFGPILELYTYRAGEYGEPLVRREYVDAYSSDLIDYRYPAGGTVLCSRGGVEALLYTYRSIVKGYSRIFCPAYYVAKILVSTYQNTKSYWTGAELITLAPGTITGIGGYTKIRFPVDLSTGKGSVGITYGDIIQEMYTDQHFYTREELTKKMKVLAVDVATVPTANGRVEVYCWGNLRGTYSLSNGKFLAWTGTKRQKSRFQQLLENVA